MRLKPPAIYVLNDAECVLTAHCSKQSYVLNGASTERGESKIKERMEQAHRESTQKQELRRPSNNC